MRPPSTSAVLAFILASALGMQAHAAPAAADLAKAAGATITADGRIRNACDEEVTPSVAEIAFGGAVGTASLLVIPGGEAMPTCYGDVPGDMYLFVEDGGAYRQVFQGGGYIMVLPTTQNGVHNFALGGPGTTFPVFAWDGSTFVSSGSISNDDLSAMGTLPSYP